jgi:hypothetical protein
VPDASEEVRELITAVALLDPKSPRRRDGISRIEQLLRQRNPSSDWSPAHYTALAVRASLSLGDIEKARTLLQLGLRFAPDEQQFQYLTRIAEREQGQPPRLSSTE